MSWFIIFSEGSSCRGAGVYGIGIVGGALSGIVPLVAIPLMLSSATVVGFPLIPKELSMLVAAGVVVLSLSL